MTVATSQSQSWPALGWPARGWPAWAGGRTTSQAPYSGWSSISIRTERSGSKRTSPHQRSGEAARIRRWRASVPSVGRVPACPDVPRAGWAGMSRLASARMAISGATDMSAVRSAVKGRSFAVPGTSPGTGGADGDNGQLRVVVSNNTKDRARARASRRHRGGHRDGGLRGLACRIAYTASDRPSSHRGIGLSFETLERVLGRLGADTRVRITRPRPRGGAQCAQTVDALAVAVQFQLVPGHARRPAPAAERAVFHADLRMRLEQAGQVLGQVGGALRRRRGHGLGRAGDPGEHEHAVRPDPVGALDVGIQPVADNERMAGAGSPHRLVG